jgi:acyl-CoA thioesterase I
VKKTTLIVLLFILFSGVLFLWLKKPALIINYPPKDGPIVAFGDSLVEGVGGTAGGDFPAVLGRMIGRPILNMGQAGDTTRDGLERLSVVLNAQPSIVLILLGGNDFLRQIPAEETFANLGQIIRRLQESGALVVLLGVRGGFLSDEFSGHYEKLAKERGTLLVPNVLKGLVGRPEFMEDTIHPNDAGYAKIAEKIFPVLKKALD